MLFQSPFTVPTSESGKLQRDDAVQLMNKALQGVIARHEAQKLAEAVAADPTIAESVEIPPNYVRPFSSGKKKTSTLRTSFLFVFTDSTECFLNDEFKACF